MKNKYHKKKYDIFPGRNRFYCDGRIIMAKQISVFYFTITLIIATCALFFVFEYVFCNPFNHSLITNRPLVVSISCPFLATEISPAIPAVAALLFIFVLCTLLRTSFTDPGILPRATPDEAADTERQIAEVPNGSNSPTYRPPPRTKEITSAYGKPKMKNKYHKKKYDIFPGRNRFYCDGRIIMAKQISVFYFTITLIIATCALFFVFDCPFLATEISPAIPAVAALLFIFVLCTLLRTSFTDPGILPRATPDEAADTERQIEVPNGSNSPTYRPPPRTKEIVINGQTIKLKYCFTCKIFRPPRASHCSLCDNCVVSKGRSLLDAVKDSPASIVVGIICFFSVWSILGLAGFHTYLTTSNQTTNEDIKGSFSSKRNHSVKNPFSKGSVYRNCCVVLCGPSTPSLIDIRSPISDEQYLAAQRARDLSRQQASQPRPSRADLSSSQSAQMSPQSKTTPTGSLGSKSIADQYLYQQQLYHNQHQHQQPAPYPQQPLQQQQRVLHPNKMVGQQQHTHQQSQLQKQVTSNPNVAATTANSAAAAAGPNANGNYNSLPRNPNQQHSHYGNANNSKPKPNYYTLSRLPSYQIMNQLCESYDKDVANNSKSGSLSRSHHNISLVSFMKQSTV
ncbi:unnamed protein product [Medioppia subpectinata]|uniref:protein S-acyltransferase n=1 Tax=Medioppia subpectinata TaxID=1979941 RepID=A0A7R9KHX2_9ACAR|nr:unnamed protein product [Medioppia subpectinata]CAG2103994.1 unnamed protein product [Medioppia subpectinata]